MGKLSFLIIVLLIGVVYVLYTQPDFFDGFKESGGGSVPLPAPTNYTSITVCNWNIQVFGVTKASNETVMAEITDTLEQCDIAIVQEIRDSTQTAFPDLCSRLQGYGCEVSERKGRSTSKEQYGLVYKLGSVTNVTESYDYDKWERPPTTFHMEYNNLSFSLLTLHSKPSDAEAEIEHLEAYADQLEGSVIVLGDLNMAGEYYELPSHDFLDWTSVIGDSEDTTVAASSNAYDRIFLRGLSYAGYGVDSTITEDVSDHYLVWVDITVQ